MMFFEIFISSEEIYINVGKMNMLDCVRYLGWVDGELGKRDWVL